MGLLASILCLCTMLPGVVWPHAPVIYVNCTYARREGDAGVFDTLSVVSQLHITL